MTTAEDVLRELYEAVMFDPEAALPATVIIRIAEREGIRIAPLGCCGAFEHTPGCGVRGKSERALALASIRPKAPTTRWDELHPSSTIARIAEELTLPLLDHRPGVRLPRVYVKATKSQIQGRRNVLNRMVLNLTHGQYRASIIRLDHRRDGNVNRESVWEIRAVKNLEQKGAA